MFGDFNDYVGKAYCWMKGSKQEREICWWDETVRSLVKQKKTMEGVAERRLQRKIFREKRESKIRCIRN